MFLKIFKQIAITALLATLFSHAAAEELQTDKSVKPAKFYFLDNVAVYIGDIDEAVDKFISDAADKKIDRIVINSRGGDAHYGIVLGQWINENQIDVEVASLCMSSCANYIFTAAKRKIIRPSALVIWHGSAEQKNLREKNEKYEEYLLLSLGGKATKEQVDYLNSDKLRYENFSRLLLEQRQFFKKIGVNEYVTRLGQEPINYDRVWTATIEVMNKMNIQNISAPEGYGNIDYLQKNHPAQFSRLVTFGLSTQGEINKLD